MSRRVTANGWKVPLNVEVVIDRLNPDLPPRFRSSHLPDAPLRATQMEAVQDWVNYHERTDR